MSFTQVGLCNILLFCLDEILKSLKEYQQLIQVYMARTHWRNELKTTEKPVS
jgi:hypothetical protein